MVNLLQQLWVGIVSIFKAPLFQLGDSSISIGSILQFVLALLIIIYFMRVFRRLLVDKLLAKLNIDAHNREAIATIISYSAGILGLIVILQTVGFNVASLAVLVGGLGVGIGLGLQNLTVNFVSGLALLLARQLRVGDFIQFDNVEGYIEEVSLQATVIRTRDGSNVVVPNNRLSNSQVVNWSYDTYTARVHIPVSVAYGSDLILVTEVLLDCAYADPHVVSDPPPKVLFLAFGSNSVDVELRVWINRIDLQPDIRSDLYFAIEEGLRQNQIEVPFPQLDLWVRQQTLPQHSIVTHPVTDTHDQIATPQPVLEVADRTTHKSRSLKVLLRNVDYFHHLTDLQLRQVIESGYRQRLAEQEVLFQEGDPGNAFYILLNGSVEVFSEQLNQSLSIINQGQFFGELSLMLGIPRSATVRALEPTQLFVISHQGFKQLLSEYPKIYDAILKELAKHQEELAKRQHQLRDLGLIDMAEDDKNLMLWVQKRLKKLFNV